MPKLRTPASVLENRKIIAAIKYGMEMQNVTNAELALTIRGSRPMLYDRLNHPDHFKLSELRAISSKLHIPLEQLVCGKSERTDTP